MASVVKPVTPPAIAQRFRELALQWRTETALESSSSAMLGHLAYQQIIALGPDVVPCLLQDLEREPVPWFEALAIITGENPVPRADWGKPAAMAQAWLAWGRKRGLVE